jgi:exopolysaccharide biosynthesis polyprenyl glycosylphosphotransferase
VLLWSARVLGDILATVLACMLAQILFDATPRYAGLLCISPLALFELTCLTALVNFIVLLACGAYDNSTFRLFSSEVGLVIRGVFITAVVIITFLFFVRLIAVSRFLLVLQFVLMTALIIFERWIIRRIALGRYRKGLHLRGLVIAGSDALAEAFFSTVVAKDHLRDLGLEYVGYVGETPNPKMEGYLGGLDVYRDLLASGGASVVISSPGWNDGKHVGSLVALASRYKAQFTVIEKNEYMRRHMRDQYVGEFRVETSQLSPYTNPAWNVLKRTGDIVLSIIALVLSSPFMLYAVCVIKKNSPGGPVIYKHQRCGLNGKLFTMYKFRTMVPNADKMKADLMQQNEAEGPTFKMKNDPRIFKGASGLRRSSIDELPQLVNVLKGQMSMVGPRPPLPREVEQYEDWQWARLAVKPGITCYWQVEGRGVASFDEWMDMDLRYVREQCFTVDTIILFRTVGAVLSRRGAY